MPGRKTDRVRERALLALMSCGTVEEAAEEAGCSERTLRAWLKEDADFRAAYAEARAAAVDDALRQLQRGAAVAARALIRRAKGDDAGHSIKAATALLDQLAKAGRAADVQSLADRLGAVEARLADVERQLAEKPSDAGHHRKNGRATVGPAAGRTG
jgi:DNA-binding transcriptional MerR regulator